MIKLSTNKPVQALAALALTASLSACDSTNLTVGQFDTPATNIQDQFDTEQLGLRLAAAEAGTDGNLLLNSGFENALKTGWDSCGKHQRIGFSHDAAAGDLALNLKTQGCVYQGAEIMPNSVVTLVCDAKMQSKRNNWTGLGIRFYDQHWNRLSDAEPAVISGRDYRAYEVTEQAPATAVYASVWFYTENKALLDNCFLSSETNIVPTVDWGTCPCVEEGGPWREAFGLPDNDLNIDSILLQDFPPVPTTWIPYDADGNSLGKIQLYGSTGTNNPNRFLFCAAENNAFTADNLNIQYDDNEEAVDEIVSCADGLRETFGLDQ